MNFGAVIFAVSMAWFASELVLAVLFRAQSTDIRRDEASQRTIWIVIAISVSIGIFIGLQRFGHFAAATVVFEIVGIGFIICGIVVRWIAIMTLKHQFTVDVAITQDHRLVTEGIYHYLRHPTYAGLLLSFLGLGLSFANIISLAVIVIPIVVAFLHRIRIEERVLTDNFRTEYKNYCASTKRLIPFVF